MEWDIGFGGSFGPEEDHKEDIRKKEDTEKHAERLLEKKKTKSRLEAIRSSELDELPYIKSRLEKLEHENRMMRDQSTILQRKLKYWREQAKELAELRLMRYQIRKNKDRSLISALKRGIHEA